MLLQTGRCLDCALFLFRDIKPIQEIPFHQLSYTKFLMGKKNSLMNVSSSHTRQIENSELNHQVENLTWFPPFGGKWRSTPLLGLLSLTVYQGFKSHFGWITTLTEWLCSRTIWAPLINSRSGYNRFSGYNFKEQNKGQGSAKCRKRLLSVWYGSKCLHHI